MTFTPVQCNDDNLRPLQAVRYRHKDAGETLTSARRLVDCTVPYLISPVEAQKKTRVPF